LLTGSETATSTDIGSFDTLSIADENEADAEDDEPLANRWLQAPLKSPVVHELVHTATPTQPLELRKGARNGHNSAINDAHSQANIHMQHSGRPLQAHANPNSRLLTTPISASPIVRESSDAIPLQVANPSRHADSVAQAGSNNQARTGLPAWKEWRQTELPLSISQNFGNERQLCACKGKAHKVHFKFPRPVT